MGVAGRTPPHADSPHSSRLTRQRAGRGSAAAKLRPLSAPRPRSASGRSAHAVAPLPQGAVLLVGARSTSFPRYPKALPALGGLAAENPRRSRSLLDFKPGESQRAPPSSLSPPLSVAFQTPLPLPPIPQLRTQSPRPSARPHLPAGAPPAGSPGPRLWPGCCSQGNEPPHEAAARTCRSLTPSPGSLGPVGMLGL